MPRDNIVAQVSKDIVANGHFKLQPSIDMLRTLSRDEYYRTMAYCRCVRRKMIEDAKRHNQS